MSQVNGQMRTCDRCGATVFLKRTGEGELDGGFTRWDCFEHADGWSVEHDVRDGKGDLCPECTKVRRALLTSFWKEAK